MRHVRKRSAETLFFPGAKVADIEAKIPGLLAKYPSVRDVVIHVGYNDVSNQTSEILKHDFSRLLYVLTVESVFSFPDICLCWRNASAVSAGSSASIHVR